MSTAAPMADRYAALRYNIPGLQTNAVQYRYELQGDPENEAEIPDSLPRGRTVADLIKQLQEIVELHPEVAQQSVMLDSTSHCECHGKGLWNGRTFRNLDYLELEVP